MVAKRDGRLVIAAQAVIADIGLRVANCPDIGSAVVVENQ
jgi:hypothetical protein